MKMYKAVVRNETTNDTPVIIEQERQFLGADFVKNAIAWAFEESCTGGIDARHVSVTVTANGDPVCEYLMFNHMTGSVVWANLYIKRRNRLMFLRRIVIAE